MWISWNGEPRIITEKNFKKVYEHLMEFPDAEVKAWFHVIGHPKRSEREEVVALLDTESAGDDALEGKGRRMFTLCEGAAKLVRRLTCKAKAGVANPGTVDRA